MLKNPEHPDDNFEDDDESKEDFDGEEYMDKLLNDDDEEPEEDHELEKKMETYKDLPVFKSAMKIFDITHAITETINEEEDFFMMKSYMLENAAVLGAKIAAADSGDIYTLRMENAVLIKIHARELQSQTSLCKAENLTGTDYLKLLRNEIDEFRKLFIDWVKTFDKGNDIKDDWGLFYD